MKTILFVDWENFKKKLESVFEKEKRPNKPNWHEYDFSGLFNCVLQEIKIDRKIFYAAKLNIYPFSEKKSKTLIEKQRLLKTYLEKQGFKFIFAGRVRANINKNNFGKKWVSFREKGVDVRIGIDMTRMAYDKELKTAILASSDSDLQPAVKELKRRNVECIYLGFETEPNKGMSYTTKRTILIRNSEVLKFCPQKLFNTRTK
ncbi:NYN domain-containing protein [Candidatus Parcubacteria bacterium]|nr:NYN domain-containing protein [Candidatus Parcubacteria bacterium]